MLFHRSNSYPAALFSLMCLSAVTAVAAAQTGAPTDRPSSVGWQSPVGASSPSASQPAQTDSASSGPVTLFPHTETGRYWISGQANSIFQMHGHFHSPYEGTNSLRDIFEYKASEVATLYLGYQLIPTAATTLT